MIRVPIRRASITWLAVVGLTAQTPLAVAHDVRRLAPPATTSNPRMIVRDIALAPGGLLVGELLDANALPVQDCEVAILAADTIVATTRTDSTGTFAVADLRGGVHLVRTPAGNKVCRFWAAGTAPPGAVERLTIRPEQIVVRGQSGPAYFHEPFPHARAIATHPLVVGGLLAAAVAIPAALNNADEPPGS